ncbi:MAG: hypothetical protein RLZZ230_705 [Candidatus Parcubacteria bacterium]|jgi:tRNA dimethylallyltransferase
MESKPKVIVVVGPTSAGKTSLSIAIAKKFNGEVISADSRQVYRGMDIGTSKVTVEEMDGVPHHLLDIVNPTETYTGADFKRDATFAINDIIERGNCPIIVGGTFFYIELLRNNLQSAPVPPNPSLRAELEELSTEALFQSLQTKDPIRAEAIDQHNRRRLIRALEIIDTLGVVPALEKHESPYDWLLIGADVEKTQLNLNIHNKLLSGLEAGMVDEVKHLHETGVRYERLDSFGLEYRYITKYLQNTLSYEEMVTALEFKIKQYAKRQLTWLRRDNSIAWFVPENREGIYKRIAEFLKSD